MSDDVMTDDELNEIERRWEKASPGPWEASTGDTVGEDQNRHCVVRSEPPQFFIAVIENGAPGDTLETEKCTAEAIASARTDGPRLVNDIRRLKEELSEHEMSFDLQWKASRRAIAMWQAANPGNDHIWPDTARLDVWLMEQIDALKAEVRGLKAKEST